MSFKSIFLWSTLLVAAFAAPAPAPTKTKRDGLCAVAPNPNPSPNSICGASGTMNPGNVYATPLFATIEDCRAQCVRDSSCKSTSFFAGQTSSNGKHYCYLSSKSLKEEGVAPGGGGIPASYDRSCSILAGECLIDDTGFEPTPVVDDKYITPWTITKGDAATYTEILSNTNKKGFTATPFGDRFYYIDKFGKPADTLDQHILLNQGSKYQMEYSYNFKALTKYGEQPQNYQIAVSYCGVELDRVTLPLTAATNQWVTRRKTITAGGCVESLRMVKLRLETGSLTKGSNYVGTFGFDEIKFSRV